MKRFKLNRKAVVEIPLKVKSVDVENATIEAVFSTENMDRHGEIVFQDFDTKEFFGNPVVLNSHRYGDATEVVGKVLGMNTVGPKPYRITEGKIQFAVKENPKAKIIYDLYAGGFLNAVSIGIIPTELDDEGNITKSTFLEVSAVAVPANAEALAKSKGIDVAALKGDVTDVLDERAAREAKWQNMKQVGAVMDAFWSAYFDTETPPDKFVPLLNETISLLQEIADGVDVVPEEPDAEGASIQKLLGRKDNAPFGQLKDKATIEVQVVEKKLVGDAPAPAPRKTKDELLRDVLKSVQEMKTLSEMKVETRPAGSGPDVRGDRTRLINQAIRGLIAQK